MAGQDPTSWRPPRQPLVLSVTTLPLAASEHTFPPPLPPRKTRRSVRLLAWQRKSNGNIQRPPGRPHWASTSKGHFSRIASEEPTPKRCSKPHQSPCSSASGKP